METTWGVHAIRALSLLDVSGKQHRNVNKAMVGDIAVLPKLDSLKTGHTLCGESHSVILQPTEFPRATIQMALRARSKAEDEKLGTCLPRIVEGNGVKLLDGTKSLDISFQGYDHFNKND